jgi:hypothetical protein
MRSTGPLCCGVMVAAAAAFSSPGAAEVVLTFGLEQRLESGRNIDLSIPEGGQTTTSVTRLSFGAVTRTQLDTLEFSSTAALVAESSDDTDGTEFDVGRPDVTLRYTREVPNAIFTVGAQYRRDDVDAFDEGIDIDDLDGTRTDTAFDLRFETGRTAPVGFAFSASYTETRYADTIDPDLDDTDILRVGIETPLRFSDILQATIRVGYEREEEASPAEVFEAQTIGAGLTYTLANGTITSDIDYRSDDEEGDRTTFVLGRTLTLPAGSVSVRLGVTNGDVGGTDVIGGVSWSQELPRGALDLLVERRVTFDEDADETEVGTLVLLNLTQEINALSSMGLSLSHEVSDAPSERIELSQVAATYRYALTDDWDLDSGVRYRVRHSAAGRSDSPDVFVALSRSFEFRP